MQIFDHLRIVFEAARVLIFEDRTGLALKSGEEQQKIVFKVEQRIHSDFQRLCLDTAVFFKGKACQPAVGGDVLILLADRLRQPIDLDVASEFRELMRVHQTLAMSVESLEQGSCKTPGGAQACSGGDIS